jgi:hypothetical protein
VPAYAQSSYTLLKERAQTLLPHVAQPVRRTRDVDDYFAHTYARQMKTVRRAKSAEDENIKSVADMFASLREGDLFMYVSGTIAPFEMREKNTVLKQRIAEAMERNVSFLYFAPQVSARNVHDEFNAFKKDVLSRLPHPEHHAERLQLVQTDAMSYFDIADSKWDLIIRKKDTRSLSLYGNALIPAGCPSETNLLFPQTPAMKKQLLAKLVRAVEGTYSGNIVPSVSKTMRDALACV